MSWLQIGGIAAAVLVAFWPQMKTVVASAGGWFRSEPATAKVDAPSFTASVDHLSKVRARLVYTESLGAEQKKAIESLTLALVGGSDK